MSGISRTMARQVISFIVQLTFIVIYCQRKTSMLIETLTKNTFLTCEINIRFAYISGISRTMVRQVISWHLLQLFISEEDIIKIIAFLLKASFFTCKINIRFAYTSGISRTLVRQVISFIVQFTSSAVIYIGGRHQ